MYVFNFKKERKKKEVRKCIIYIFNFKENKGKDVLVVNFIRIVCGWRDKGW